MTAKLSAKPQRIEFLGSEHNKLVSHMHGSEGRPVLFFHGGGQTRHAWDRAVEEMGAHGTRAITVDMRGHGESAWAESGNYRFDAYADDVSAVVRQVGDRFGMRPVAVGASLGGLSALLAEVLHPGLLEALVLVDITPDMDQDGVAKIQGFMGENMEEGFASLEEAAEAIARYLPHRKRPKSLAGLGKNLRQDEDGRYRWHWDPRFLNGPMNINVNAYRLMTFCKQSAFDLELPVLLVRGMQSELVNEEAAKKFVSSVRGARYVDVQDAGHMVAGDKNDVFSGEIIAFLKPVLAAESAEPSNSPSY